MLLQLVTAIVAVIPAIAGALGGVLTIVRINNTRRAERNFSSLLARDKKLLHKLENLTSSQVDAETFNEAIKLLRTRVDQLREEDQKQIVEGLSQSSEKSRKNYMVKLVTEGERMSEGLC